jgi:hypothetical protein
MRQQHQRQQKPQVQGADARGANVAAPVNAAAAQAAQFESRMREYDQRLARVRKERREAITKWRASTGTELHAPEIERGTSIRVDIFGRLRGSAPGCAMWRRDIATAAHWSDTRVLTCQARGAAACAVRRRVGP